MSKIRVGLYGSNGHQIHNRLIDHPHAEIVAVAAFGPAAIPDHLTKAGVQVYESLDELLASDVQLVSLCSPRRADQADDAIRSMEAGKHVYAEKPCALRSDDVDRITATAHRTGVIFHEMASTAFDQPYCTLRRIVESGVLGTIVQVYSQKSYPWHDGRLQDEQIDGGLATQAGVYNARFVEHVAGVRIRSLTLKETRLGNPIADGQCRRAVSMIMELENGGAASGVANYLCPAPPWWGKWGYETVRIWGTNGFIESIDSGRIGTIAITGQDPQTLDFSDPFPAYLDMFIDEIRTGKKIIPFTLEKEISPTRWVVLAKGGSPATASNQITAPQ